MSDALRLHKRYRGKIETCPKYAVTKDTLGLAYTPGVADVSRLIEEKPELVDVYTLRGHTVAIVSDGSAVLGLGDIGPRAALPVMEGKAMLLKAFGGVDGFPIVLDTKDAEEIERTVRLIAPTFGGIILEDIGAPKCFALEERLQDLDIPVLHDDQHGTSIVVLAALLNAAEVVGKKLKGMTVVVVGAGAAGTAIAKLLLKYPIKEVRVCDSKGILHPGRDDLPPYKKELATRTAPSVRGTMEKAFVDADAFIGVSRGDTVVPSMIESMADDPIVFALANPTPEIMPSKAKDAGARIIATGRSDFPNQVNNVLAYPGLFKGTLAAKAAHITESMKFAASQAIAACVKRPTPNHILPSAFNKRLVPAVSRAVTRASGRASEGSRGR